MLDLNRPVAVFDAGLGSYGVVKSIRRQFPEQDIIYLADRASFPYGGKSREILAPVILRAVQYLELFDPAAVIIASNSPTIMVFDLIEPEATRPLFGIYPPIKEALTCSQTGSVAVLGVKSMVESEELQNYIRLESKGSDHVKVFNASEIVALVESGEFLFDRQKTVQKIAAFMSEVKQAHPAVDVATLSSTHLPWMQHFFEAVSPEIQFLDPTESILKLLKPLTIAGKGKTVGLITENEKYPADQFLKILERLEIHIETHVVDIQNSALSKVKPNGGRDPVKDLTHSSYDVIAKEKRSLS